MKELTVYDDIGKLPDNWVAILKDAKLQRISKCAKEELEKFEWDKDMRGKDDDTRENS